MCVWRVSRRCRRNQLVRLSWSLRRGEPLIRAAPSTLVAPPAALTRRCSSSQARGYPCGLWMLLHALVAHSTDETAASALRTIRDYVDRFFSCHGCRQHFIAMFDSRPPDAVRTVDDAALWLWRAHNAVNLRLNRSGEGGASLLPPLSSRSADW